MKITVNMEVRPWVSPNYVACEIGGKETSIPISEVDHQIIHQLVVAWMVDVYRKAGMEPDWRFE